MKKTSPISETLSVVQGINSVLDAETQAIQELEQRQQEAEAILAEARRRAHRIQERANLRQTLIHQRCSRLVSKEVNRLQASAKSQRQQEAALESDPDVVQALVLKIAESLISDPGDDENKAGVA